MLTGQGLVEHAYTLLGVPYFYGSKLKVLTESFMLGMKKAYPSIVNQAYIDKARRKGMVGKVCVDCSGLISSYTGKVLGSAQLYAQASKRLPISSYRDFAPGTVVWRKGHVGVFVKEGNNYYVIEAKGIDWGTVRSIFDPSKWSYGLVFPWMTYSYEVNLAPIATSKGKNPYKEPTINIKKNMYGESVKWVQWELVEAGYKIDIDGEFGPKTEEALKAFQTSCKISADGICGNLTRKKLKKGGI